MHYRIVSIVWLRWWYSCEEDEYEQEIKEDGLQRIWRWNLSHPVRFESSPREGGQTPVCIIAPHCDRIENLRAEREVEKYQLELCKSETSRKFNGEHATSDSSETQLNTRLLFSIRNSIYKISILGDLDPLLWAQKAVHQRRVQFLSKVRGAKLKKPQGRELCSMQVLKFRKKRSLHIVARLLVIESFVSDASLALWNLTLLHRISTLQPFSHYSFLSYALAGLKLRSNAGMRFASMILERRQSLRRCSVACLLLLVSSSDAHPFLIFCRDKCPVYGPINMEYEHIRRCDSLVR